MCCGAEVPQRIAGPAEAAAVGELLGALRHPFLWPTRVVS